MKKRMFLSFIFLIIGVIIYFLFDIGIMTKQNYIFSIVRNFFPDICWTFSFFFASIIFAANISKNSIFLNSLYVFSIALFYELLQYFHLTKGTFDLFDISSYVVSIIIACLIEKNIRRKENEEK